MVEKCEDLEGLDERKEETQEHSYRYRKRMTEAYDKTIKERVITVGQLVLRTVDHVQ